MRVKIEIESDEVARISTRRDDQMISTTSEIEIIDAGAAPVNQGVSAPLLEGSTMETSPDVQAATNAGIAPQGPGETISSQRQPTQLDNYESTSQSQPILTASAKVESIINAGPAPTHLAAEETILPDVTASDFARSQEATLTEYNTNIVSSNTVASDSVGQCQAMTIRGRQCKNRPLGESPYCHVHQPSLNE